MLKPNEEELKDFWYFVQERHNIYYKRFVKKEPKPWTKDRVLRDYFFTNVYRELDRGSLYLIDNIINYGGGWSACNAALWQGSGGNPLFNSLTYRYFNTITNHQ